MRHRTPIVARCVVYAVSLSLIGSHAAIAAGPEPITTQSLLSELTDLARLADLPSVSYTTKQSSSHDPQSTTPKDPKSWFANEDADHWHGIEQHGDRTEYVMLSADGPGAIVRIWSANPAGTLRVYLDGSEKPVIEAPMDLFLGGKSEGVPEPIAGVYSRGYNLYLPIPYAKSCKVTADQKGFYYSVDYRTYTSETPVTSFTHDDIERFADDIAQQAKLLAAPGDAGVKPQQRDAFDVTIPPVATATLGKLDGARAISEFRVQLPKDVSEAALRAAMLRITFDNERCVEAPLGDFFGSAPGVNPFESLPLGMTESRELYAHWIMPFRESAVVEVRNLGPVPISFKGELGSVPRPWTFRSMHFNAGYCAEFDRDTRPQFDWNYLTAQGPGRFVGASFAIDNPVKAWWGEGDEKFYVDGETQPSWFGTGSEDYYGYAWGSSDRFQHAYHSQSRCDGPVAYGRTSVNRFHIVDDVPFVQSFRFDMEIWHWTQCKLNFAATTYWYATPGGNRSFAPLTLADLAVRPMPAYKPHTVAGAIEGESMKVGEHAGDIGPQEWADLSGDNHLLWRAEKAGDTLTLAFDVPTAGRYRVMGRFLKADDYGIVKLAIDGQETTQPIDFYNDSVKLSDEMDLGVFGLPASTNKLTVTSIGTSDKGRHGYLFGLDYLRLTPPTSAK